MKERQKQIYSRKGYVQAIIDNARPQLPAGCQRSHPHEDMNEVCGLKTEIARLRNALAQSVESVRRMLEEKRPL